MNLRHIDRLDECYQLDKKTLFITGLQALVRLLLLQHDRDQRAGLNTAGFVSGYRGSPLGGLDRELWRASEVLDQAGVCFQPGLNEELAATSIWGTQQATLFPGAQVDGVFSLWYGKGPGVDRSGDAFKHGNAAGTSRHGGVLVAAGDDHACKSSTLPQQSEYSFMDAMMPVLNPANVQELIELGLMGYALSRFSGCWVGMKVIQETADASQTIDFDHDRFEIVQPEFELPAEGLGIRWPDPPLEQEVRLHQYKLKAAAAFARVNRLDRIVIDSPKPRLGLITTGKSHGDTLQALADLGIGTQRAREVGIRLYKVGMSWPLEAEGIREFAEGLEEILVIEEKRGVIEAQVKEQLFDRQPESRLTIVGKLDEHGDWLLPSAGELSAATVARALGKRLSRYYSSPDIDERLNFLAQKDDAVKAVTGNGARAPHFCSGCPHNISTRVPEGSLAIAGIGCHFMAAWMGRNTETYTQMGGEGATWIGHAPFTDTEHVFQNLGDGTYTHSGSLAIRAAVAAGVNITYKILYNDAVAMTGGQPVEGGFTAGQVAQQLVAEGVRPVLIVSDDPKRVARDVNLPKEVSVHHRRELDRLQLDLREQRGVSALIYDQTCAAELRRKRKRGLIETPAQRVVINELVCEGCGDCNRISNCLSVVPVETEFGRKRAINQSSCNRDFSCLDGFCPSFVTLHGAEPKAPVPLDPDVLPSPPEPAKPDLSSSPYNVLIAGVGGTGVVTASGLIGLAAHLEGKAVMELDQTGLAQKFGAVLSHIRIAQTSEDLHSARIPAGQVDLLLGGDLLVAAGKESLITLAVDRSAVLVNTHEEMPPSFITERDLEFPGQALLAALGGASRPDGFFALDASRLAKALTGDSLSANVLLLGAALQRGLLPVAAESLERALELFGSNVEQNKRALAWGRYAVFDPDKVEQLAGGLGEPAQDLSSSLDEIVSRRMTFLGQYQDRAYAERYGRLVARVRAVENEARPDSTELAEAVARNYFKLLAYKDEYEVARLYTQTGFLEQLRSEYQGRLKLRFHFSPPLIAGIDSNSGRPKKYAFGSWILVVLRVLAKFRFVRGTALDLFSYTKERRLERQLIADYEALLAGLCEELDEPHYAMAVELAGLPDQIRGYGPIKQAAVETVGARREALLDAWKELRERLVPA
ncbi:MAG: indolepyruvate ferredoxin oxidoreductase family protein [Gammaproteobacteria bacterium]|nr:indolepyruvate ferredoxin oxidoreductase family protein [Gammaproteobacteria bacterium]